MGGQKTLNEAMSIDAKKSNAVFRSLAAIWFLSTIVLVSRYQQDALGYAADSADGVEHVAAGTTPAALVLALVGVVCLIVLTRTEPRIGDFHIAPMWRRYSALLLDFWFFIFTYGALTAVIPLILEASRTGKFQWAFERDHFVPSDWIGGALIVIGLSAMVAYFVLPLSNRRQTIGRWMLRIATVNIDGSAVRLPLFVALRRTYREVRELLSPSTLWRMLRGKPKQDGSYDENDRLVVVRY